MRIAVFGSLLAGLAFAAPALSAAQLQGGGFTLSVPEAAQSPQDEAAGYARLRDGQVYTICLASSLDRRSDVELSVDGLPMGVFRLNPYQTWCLERPRDSQGRYTFYRAGSAGGIAAGSQGVDMQARGIVRARFVPERAMEPPPPPPRPAQPTGPSRSEESLRRAPTAAPPPPTYAPAPQETREAEAAATDSLSSGVTGLTGQSAQTFRDVERIRLDQNAAVVLELRLVHDERLEEPRPLPGRFDRPAPPPILR